MDILLYRKFKKIPILNEIDASHSQRKGELILFWKWEERLRVLFCRKKFLFKRKRMNVLSLLLKMDESMISTLRLTAINLC